MHHVPTMTTTTMIRQQYPGADRRAHPRRGVRVRVECSVPGGRVWWGFSRDLSRGGMFLEYTPGMAVGDTIMLAFVLPTGRPCKLKAQVVRVEPIGAAVRFVETSEPPMGKMFQDLASYCAV